jgi:hypothetical protein
MHVCCGLHLWLGLWQVMLWSYFPALAFFSLLALGLGLFVAWLGFPWSPCSFPIHRPDLFKVYTVIHWSVGHHHSVGQLTFSVDSGLQMPPIFFMDVYTLYTCLYEWPWTNRAQDACMRRQVLYQNMVIVDFHDSEAIFTAVFLRSTNNYTILKCFNAIFGHLRCGCCKCNIWLPSALVTTTCIFTKYL